MPCSSSRKGRKLNRPALSGPRLPACKSCQRRRVKCDGGDPCSACLRKAAWDGVPPPTPGLGGGCEYEGGRAPCPRASGSRSKAIGRVKREEDDESDFEEQGGEESARSFGGKGGKKGKGKARETGGGGAGGGGKPLQKGLACLACKARRVRCDGAKPACGACVKLMQKQEGCECVYRADLWVREQAMKLEEKERMKDEVLDDDHTPAPQPLVKRESPIPVLPMFDPSRLPPLPPLPSKLPALPPLPQPQSLPTPQTPSVPLANPCCAAPSSLCLSSMYPSLPFPTATTTSTSFSASTSTYPFPYPPNQHVSALATAPLPPPPSPSTFSTSTPSLFDYSSAWSSYSSSAFPSPRTPLESLNLRIANSSAGGGAGENYPPVPYPPSAAAGGINPFWTTTNAIPPLALEDCDVETLALGAGLGGVFCPPPPAPTPIPSAVALYGGLGVGGALGLEGFVPPSQRAEIEAERAAKELGMGGAGGAGAGMDDVTLTLPMFSPQPETGIGSTFFGYA
ncbi:hypothetical protein JCM8547_003928 [Rhodosporidiobolus lusitaniae]